MNIVNTVPPGLIVTCRPAAEPLAVTVTVAPAPALIVPPEGLSCTVPDPLDTVLDQVTGPPCAVSEIVVPPGGTHSAPPDGDTERVPGVALMVGVAVDDAVAVGVGLVVADGGAAGVVARFAAVGVPCGVVVAEPVGVAVAVAAVRVAELVGEVPGEAPNGAAAEAPVGGTESATCPAACFPCPELSISTKATEPMKTAATKPPATATRPRRRPSSPRAGTSFGSGNALGKPWESNIPA
jgi:hypothetical protein